MFKIIDKCTFLKKFEILFQVGVFVFILLGSMGSVCICSCFIFFLIFLSTNSTIISAANDAIHILIQVVDCKKKDLAITDAGGNTVGWDKPVPRVAARNKNDRYFLLSAPPPPPPRVHSQPV